MTTLLAIIGFVDDSGATESDDIDFVLLLITLFGGLAIFLLGLDRLTESMRLVAGSRMRSILSALTANRFVGMLTGAGVTAVIQSSSVTTVLVVGFISSGLMTLAQSIGVILGANIGTTVTAQIIAFSVTKYALLIVAIGFGMTFFSKNDDRQTQGALVMGLGLVFFGMNVMGDAMRPLRTYEPFIDAMAAMENPLIGIAAAAAFTALVQSSSATTGVVIVLASQGLITIEAGIALVLGANIGTSVTAGLAAIGKPREAQRAALAHTIFNVVGVLLWVLFIGILADMVTSIGGPTARQVANAHTIFNIINALLFLGFTTQFAHLVERLLPDRPGVEEVVIRARYLDTELLRTPSLALDRARLEMLRVADRIRGMLDAILPAVLDGTRGDLIEVETMDDEVDALHGHIISYLGAISKTRLGQDETEELIALMEATNDLEAIGDVIETNLVTLGLTRLEHGIVVSDATRAVLTEFHGAVAEALGLSMMALTQKNDTAARKVSHMKGEINSMEHAASLHQAERLVADEPNRVETYRLEVDVIANLKRIYYFSKRIARLAVPEGERASM
jgi:phosphate:Na+ symporter